MVAGSPLLRPRDADALRAELRRVAEESGMPLTFGGEVHDHTLLLTEFIGTRSSGMLRDAHLAGMTGGGAVSEEVREVHAQLRRLAADPSAPPALRAQLRVLGARLTGGRPSGPAAALSAREIDVLAQVALGCTNAQAAKRLSLKPETVKSYLRSATAKLDAHTRHEAVAKARRARLLP
jgi:DNA-binding CsgD family transcriptional regulator